MTAENKKGMKDASSLNVSHVLRYPANRASIFSLSSLFDVVFWPVSKILALPGFRYFSVEHARSFHDNTEMFKRINLTFVYYKETYIRRIMEWNACSLHMFERFTLWNAL